MPAASVKRAAVPGWYGKMPSLGDFASRRLPAEFVRRWDDWLQEGMVCARAQLGPEWLSVYLVAPVRRFWIAPGLIGASGWVGVLMPSVDGVGRYFPLTIAAAAPPVARSLAVALAASDWYRAVDATARLVLDIEFGVDDFEAALAQVGPMPADGGVEAAPLAQAARDAQGAFARSVWWCGDAGAATPFESHPALPPVSAFSALMLEAA